MSVPKLTAKGADIVDWLALGGTRGMLTELAAAAPEWKPPTSLPTLSQAIGSEVPSWEVCGNQLVEEAGTATEPNSLPVLGQPGIMVRGWSHLFAGYPRKGKTELLARLVRSWLDSGETVLYLAEEARSTWALRLAGIGGDWSGLMVLFGLGIEPAVLLARMRSGAETVVIVDTIRNLLQLVDERHNSEVARILNPWIGAAREGSKTIIFTHHMRKGSGEHGEGIAGGHALLAAADVGIELLHDQSHATRRVLRTYPRLLPQRELVYERRQDGSFVALGEPDAVRKDEVKRRLLELLTGDWQTTKELHGALEEPQPSQEQVRLALGALAQEHCHRSGPAY